MRRGRAEIACRDRVPRSRAEITPRSREIGPRSRLLVIRHVPRVRLHAAVASRRADRVRSEPALELGARGGAGYVEVAKDELRGHLLHTRHLLLLVGLVECGDLPG